MPYLGILGLEFIKNYCHIWNQHSQIFQTAKFWEKTKKPKFGTQIALFEYFCPGIWKQYFHIWNQHFKICVTAKFCEK